MNAEKEARVKAAIEEIKAGRCVIMIDDEDRENEGDLVFGACFSTPEMVNFLIKEARGVLCVALAKDIAARLELAPMVEKNSSSHETAFTVSVDARSASTGVSAYERDMTIKLLANAGTKPNDLVRPGHIFPLIAKKGGVLERTGHTEGSIDLCKMAGIYEAAVICEIVKEDGNMARRADLEEFGKKHGIKTIFVADLIEYRLENESLIRLSDTQDASFFGKPCKKIIATDYKDNKHIVYQFGAPQKNAFVKFHAISSDTDLIEDASRYYSLKSALEYMLQGGGFVVCLDLKHLAGAEQKNYGIGAQILKKMGVSSIKLITRNAQNSFVAMSGFGLNIEEEIILNETIH
ncbi:MAG: bifunctional 3,4-dihydroxy-2-butanone 4-phosphate synthase/GTP cyclohydrolase II [Helicobacteraceae bacterium]